MRYYRIEVTNEDGSPFFFGSNKTPAIWTTFVNGQTDLGALLVEFDIPVTTLAQPLGFPDIKIWGAGLEANSQAADFNGKLIKVYGGMKPGLPLATAASQNNQAGLLVQGQIFQAFGNWIMTNQVLEFLINVNGSEIGKELNITLNWKKGQKLADAVKQTLATALPDYKFDAKINDNLVLPEDDTGQYENLTQFSQHIKDISASILNPNGQDAGYQGVDISLADKSFLLRDGTSAANPKMISFNDLIGQPTWLGPNELQVTTVMRADLGMSDFIKLPTTQITTTGASLPAFRDKSVFQGSFFIWEMRHVGNSRSPDATSWVTTMSCSPQGQDPTPAPDDG